MGQNSTKQRGLSHLFVGRVYPTCAWESEAVAALVKAKRLAPVTIGVPEDSRPRPLSPTTYLEGFARVLVFAVVACCFSAFGIHHTNESIKFSRRVPYLLSVLRHGPQPHSVLWQRRLHRVLPAGEKAVVTRIGWQFRLFLLHIASPDHSRSFACCVQVKAPAKKVACPFCNRGNASAQSKTRFDARARGLIRCLHWPEKHA
jgi:hypothetical protein